MLALILALSTTAIADYSAPTPSGMMKTASGIIDATVTRYDGDGAAILMVHQIIDGESTDKISDVRLSCFGGSPKVFGMEEGKRYVIILDRGELYEETSFFEVRGDLEVKFWSRDNHWERDWTDMNEVRERVQANRN